jgi:hypothetical protein
MSEPQDDGWFYIWDDVRLSVFEKAMAQAIRRRQFKGNPVLLKREVIMELANISRSQVIRCEKSLRNFGYLRWARTDTRHVFCYQVVRLQGDFFDKGKVRRFTQCAAGTTGSAARPEGSGETVVSTGNGPPGYRSQQVQIDSQNLTKTNTKTAPTHFKTEKQRQIESELRAGTAPRPSREWRERRQAGVAD